MKQLSRAGGARTIQARLEDAGYKVQVCRACSTKIVFAKTDTGQRMPLDISSPVYALGSANPTGGGMPVATRMNQCFVSHFKTCSDPSSFSGKS